MWAKLGKAFFTALIVVLVAELIARGMMGRVEFAHSYDVSRNPNYRRAWPAFTEPRPRGADEKLVILISNSQGFAHELEDESLIYAHLLEEQLNKTGSGNRVTIANWSLGGVSGPEMLVLAARAVGHEPDLLMLVTHSNPFSYKRLEQPLSFYLSDVGLLAYTQPVRLRLPSWFLRKHWVYDPATFLGAHSGLVRWRNTFTEQRHRRWLIAPKSGEPRNKPRKLYSAPEVRGSGQRLLAAWVDVFREDRPDTPVLMVNMPLSQPSWTPQAWARLQKFGRAMQGLAESNPGVTAIDAIDAIDPAMFLTRTHLSARGHAEFAEYLLPTVADRLDLSPGHP
jgi:hypothetical protein